MSGSVGILETFWMREFVLPFKAGESKLAFINVSGFGKHRYFVKDNTRFFHTEREMSPGPCL